MVHDHNGNLKVYTAKTARHRVPDYQHIAESQAATQNVTVPRFTVTAIL